MELCEARPDLSGNPFLWLEKLRQKDWERKADKGAQKIKKNDKERPIPEGLARRNRGKTAGLDDLKIFSIGKTTTSELKKLTENKIITSHKNTLADLLNLISKESSTDRKADLED